MAKKSSGLNKKVSSIFSGIPSLDDTQPSGGHSSKAKPDASEILTPQQYGSVARDFLKSFFNIEARPRLIFDVGTARVKAVLAVWRAGKWVVKGTLEHEFEMDQQGRAKAEEAELADALKTLADVLDPDRRAQAGLVITGSQILLTTTKAPEEPGKRWRDAISWQLADTAVFPIEEAELVWRAEHYGEEAAEFFRNRLVVSAVPQQELERILDIFRQAGLKLEIITPPGLAVEWLMKNYREPLPKTSLVMDMGAENTFFHFFYNGGLLFTRQFAFGAGSVSRALTGTILVDQERVNVTFSEAATLIEKYQLLSSVQQLDPLQPKRSQLVVRLRPVREKLIAEIKRSLSYYQSEFSAGNVEKIFLMGGGSHIKELDQFLESELHLPVKKLDIAKDFLFSFDPVVSQMASSLSDTFGPVLGLAHAGAEAVNFAPWQERWRPVSVRVKRWLKAGTCAVAVVGVIFWTMLAFGAHQIERQKKQVKAALNSQGPRTQQLEELNRLDEAIETRKEKLLRGLGLEPLWGGVLRELSQIIPRETILDRLEVGQAETTKELALYGYIQSPTAPSDAIVSSFLKALNQSPYFSAATLISRAQEEAEENTRATFNIKTTLR